MANYTVRDNSRQIDVVITGGPGNESWTVTAAPPFTFEHFRETGSGNETLTGPIIDSREYEITVDPISGYNIPPVANVTAGASTQTFNVAMTAEGNTGDLSIVLSPDFGQGWTITGPSYPTGFSGNGSTSTPLTITQGGYSIAYDDDRIHLNSPPGDIVVLGASATLTGTYTIRNTFAVNVSILDDGGTPTGSFGNWDITNDDGFGFTATGDWDTNNSPVTPSLGDFYEGRAYTLDFTDEVGYTPLANQAITAAGTYEGDYLLPVSGACDAFLPDVSVSGDTWSPAVALTPSSSTSATADFYIRPTAQNQGALIGFAKNTPIWDYSDCAALIRFNDLGTSTIDVRDGGAYCSDGGAPSCSASISYTAGHWYHFVVDFDITNKRYTVQVEDCNDGLVVLHQSAAFRTDAAPNDDAIGYWALNAFTGDIISEYGMQWDAEGTTPPTTGTISINVTPETGNWTLNGPNFYQLIDTGDRTLSNLAFGDYTITYGNVGGYDPPVTNPDNTTLSSGSPSHQFLGTYRATGTQSKSVYGIGHSLLSYDTEILLYTKRIVEVFGHNMTHDEYTYPGQGITYNWDRNTVQDANYNPRAFNALATGNWHNLILTPSQTELKGGDNGTVVAGWWHERANSPTNGHDPTQCYLYTTWQPRASQGGGQDATWRARLTADGNWGDGAVAAVNAAHDPPDMIHLPVGSKYVAELYDEIYFGAGVAGLSSIDDVFNDTSHMNTTGRYFVALAFASEIFGIDVRGADISYNDKWNAPPDGTTGPAPSQATATALQNLVYSIWSS